MSTRLRSITAAAAAFVTALVLVGCGRSVNDSLPVIDFQTRTALPAEGQGTVRPLTIAVGAMLSAEGNLDSYTQLASYLETELDRPIEIVQRRTYEEINDLLRTGEADIGFVCTSAYVAGNDLFGLDLIAAPVVDGQTVYHSELIVPASSSAESMADLRGTRFAFTDPISTTGRVYPTSLVQELGETPDTFFSSTVFTYSHDRAVHAVAAELVDGAGVDSLVLDSVLTLQPELRDRIKVIDRSPAFGIPPVVASPALSATQRATLEDILFGLDEDSDGEAVLDALGIEGFTPIDDQAYDSVRTLFAAVGSR